MTVLGCIATCIKKVGQSRRDARYTALRYSDRALWVVTTCSLVGGSRHPVDEMSVSASNTTNFLIPRNRVLHEKLMVCELLEIFPAFHGTRRFIAVFKRACHLSLSWATLMQSTPSHPFYLRSVLIHSSHRRLGLRIALFMFLPLCIRRAFHIPHPSHPPLIWSHE